MTGSPGPASAAPATPTTPATPSAPPTPAGPVRRLQSPTPRAALAISAAVVLLFLLVLASDALTPFLVGLILVYLLHPAVERLTGLRVAGWRLPRWVAILVLYVVVVIVIVVGLSLLLRPLVSQLSTFIDRLPAFLESLHHAYLDLDVPAGVRTLIDRSLTDLGSTLGGAGGGAGLASILPLARTLAGAIAAVFGYLIAPVWAFYILKDSHALAAGFERALPPAWRDDALAVLRIFEHTFGRWLRGQLLLGVVVGVATLVGLLAIGEFIDPIFVGFAILLAVVAGILELLPLIGPILSMIPALLIALTASDPLRAMVAVLVLYILVQQVENNVLVPRIQGDSIELHPAVVILALIVGGAIFGFVGAVFSLPVTAAARDIYRYLFRRASSADPDVPHPDAPDLASKTGRRPWVEAPTGTTTAEGATMDGTQDAGTQAPTGAQEATR